jgi:EAL domain-containing protein (putative c-di-GMP-specific phosphodiesterase class I)
MAAFLNSPGCGGACADTTQFSLTMAFQPVVDVSARRIYGYEALVRGQNGESAAAMLSMVTDETRYAFDQACRVKAIQLAARLGLDRRLSINFMPNAVYHPEACLRLTLDAARDYGFPPELITFEFTENEQIIDRDRIKSIIATYRRYGFQTALDDFGAGYAGLSLLADFQPDIIKIDRYLVADIDSSATRQAILAGVVATARSLGMLAIAEGVERREELETLERLGITHYQGYLFGRPMIERLIADEEIDWA